MSVSNRPQTAETSGSSALLDNTANNLHAFPSELENRTARWSARAVLWGHSSLDRVRACGHHPLTPSGVAVRQFGNSVGYSGLPSCGSVWACPACNARIQAERRLEITVALAKAPSSAFGAYTISHTSEDDLDTLWRSLSKVWAATQRDRQVQKIKKTLDHLGTIRGAEVTKGFNGWHPHLHPIHLFGRKVTTAEVAALHYFESTAWVRAAERFGLKAPSHEAQKLQLVKGGSDEKLGAYLAKSVYDSVALEVTSTQSKTRTRAKDSKTPWQILHEFKNTGDLDLLDIWHEWEKGSKGKRSLTWSQGLRKKLDLESERSDEEIAEQEIGTHEHTQFWITDWSPIQKRPEIGALILNAQRTGGTSAALKICLENSVTVEVLNV